MSRARRKMRRKLMKQMRKGSLSAAERRELLELDREVNKANRQAAGIGGAGLAAALAIASKAGAGDALGEFLDKRQEKKKKKAEFQAESQKIGEKVSDQVRKDAKKELIDSLPKGKDSESVSQEDIKKRMKAIEGIEIEDLTEEDFKDEGLETDLANYEMQKIIDANPALAAMLGRGEAPPSDVQPGRFDAGEGTAFDDLPKNKELMVGGEAGPTRDDAGFVEAERVQAAREAMQDFRDSEPTEAEERAARRQRLLDERMMQDDMGNMEMIVGPGREQGFDDPIGLGAMPAGSGIPFRMDGPRVSNEYGGNTPFLRKMRDRIRKKFR